MYKMDMYHKNNDLNEYILKLIYPIYLSKLHTIVLYF